jgi:tRNA dimethylallyltransferase
MSILIVICGPTATGKTGLAIALSERVQGMILSADSRQVYREFDIGTAKPTKVEQVQAPHCLIDICDPRETLTLADYQTQAQQLIQNCHRQEESGAVPLLVGGTGLYIKSVVRGLIIPRVPPQPQLRSQLAEVGQPQCYVMLQQIDPVAAQKIHPNDQTRTIRALEVFYTTGIPISQQQGEHPPTYPMLHIGLDCEGDGAGDALTQRIQRRTQTMMDLGFVDEAQRLCEKYGAALPLLNTLGYQEVKQSLRGEISLEEAQRLTVLHTRQFAKRQRTWFRADSSIRWFDSDAPDLVDQVWAEVQAFMSREKER